MGSDKFNFKEEIVDQIEKSAALKDDVISKHVGIINDIANKIINAYSNNNKVIWFGNGGSAADAQHLSCELVSKFLLDREAIPSIALTTNTSILTAVPNDYRYEDVFKRQVEALAQKGDILIGITTSGTSPNVLKALESGKKKGTVNIAFTGKRAAEIKELVDYLIDIP
ncbi:MAG: SIS domain-containing protein, partial [Thermoplasmatales archaeon]|nr:SIS domain-containing protein [Thermoplasmatales archaeon]